MNDDLKKKIADIIRSYEDAFSDGFGYYCGSSRVDATLLEMADEILNAINPHKEKKDE